MNAAARGGMVWRSRIEQEKPGSDLFEDRNLGKRDVIVLYYGSLVYTDSRQQWHSTKRYEEGGMQGTAESFRKRSVEMDEKVRDRTWEKQTVWVGPALFCAMQCIKDPRYL